MSTIKVKNLYLLWT